MSNTILAKNVDSVKVLTMMAKMLASAQANVSKDVRLITSMMEICLYLEDRSFLIAECSTMDDTWTVSGDARLGVAVQKLICS